MENISISTYDELAAVVSTEINPDAQMWRFLLRFRKAVRMFRDIDGARYAIRQGIATLRMERDEQSFFFYQTTCDTDGEGCKVVPWSVREKKTSLKYAAWMLRSLNAKLRDGDDPWILSTNDPR